MNHNDDFREGWFVKYMHKSWWLCFSADRGFSIGKWFRRERGGSWLPTNY